MWKYIQTLAAKPGMNCIKEVGYDLGSGWTWEGWEPVVPRDREWGCALGGMLLRATSPAPRYPASRQYPGYFEATRCAGCRYNTGGGDEDRGQ